MPQPGVDCGGVTLVKPVIYMACPTHDHTRHDASCRALAWAAQRHDMIEHRATMSLLAHSFNIMWLAAHARKRQGVTHFAMLHADIAPTQPDWLEVLLAEMQRKRLDVLCAAAAMKEPGARMTSCGKTRLVDGEPRPEKFSQARLATLPETLTAADVCEDGEHLLLNTGCLLVDIRGAWCDPERVFFHVRDWVERGADGSHIARVEPEDWFFSRKCHENGARLGITTAVPLDHWGLAAYRTQAVRTAGENDNGS